MMKAAATRLIGWTPLAATLAAGSLLLWWSGVDRERVAAAQASHELALAPAQAELHAPKDGTALHVPRIELQAPAAFGVQAPDPLADVIEGLRRELEACQRRVHWMEVELAVAGAENAEGPLAQWLATLRPEEIPDAKITRAIGYVLQDYPVHLSPDEGLWLAERFRLNDWKLYAPTIDEAVIGYLGSDRIASEVSGERLEALRLEWQEEGFFRP